MHHNFTLPSLLLILAPLASFARTAFVFDSAQKLPNAFHQQQQSRCKKIHNIRDNWMMVSSLIEETPITTSQETSKCNDDCQHHHHMQEQRRHSIFSETNLYSLPTRVPPNVWDKILPTPFSSSSRGTDVSVTFLDPADGAREILHKCNLHDTLSPQRKKEAQEHLSQCLAFFQNVVSIDNPKLCKARIVSSRGKSGTKCPRWHIDHVPVRLILALVGPGVSWLPSEVVQNLDDVNARDEIDTNAANRVILNQAGGSVKVEKSFNTGDMVLLMGKAWENVPVAGTDFVDFADEDVVHAAVHRSPPLMPFQGRVLLTVDVIDEQ